MAGKKPAVSSSEPRLGGLRIQTSLYGQTVPVVYGRTRITGNLMWYDGFKATRQEERSEASKGGGSRPSRAYYTYSASVMMLLAEGPIVGVRTLYKGKQKFSGQTIPATSGSTWISTTVPSSSPYQVTVPSPSGWVSNLGVDRLTTDPLGWPPTDRPLVEGVDYTVAGGVYTFAATHAGAPVAISYVTSTAASSVDALGQLGLALARGEPGQAVWSYLQTDWPAAALPYSGFAYVRGRDYELTSAAEVENHSFEVDGFLGSQANGDARPADVIRDILTDTRYGSARWASGLLADMSVYQAYCDAYGLVISPAFTEQRATRDWLAEILEATNTDAAWTGSQLKLVPRGDENAGSYVAPVTPVYDLGPDDFLAERGEPPLRMLRVADADAHNIVRVEFWNRARDYNVEIVAASDEDAIQRRGRREESPQAWHFFADGNAAQSAAQLRLQRKQKVRAPWEFRLPFRFAELEPGDLVTLTDPDFQLDRWPVRVTSIREIGDDFEVTAEDFPIGHATAPVIAPQLGSGFRPDFNRAPGAVAEPMFFEPPGGYTQNGLEVWVALSGLAGEDGRYWGGAEVYASLDGGSSYKLVARVDQGSRHGTLAASLAADAGAVMDVALAGRGGQLRSVSAAEADSLLTLMFVGSPATGEFVSFESASLTGANAYRLSGLRRGAYGTTQQAAASGTPVVYIDGAIAMSGPLPVEMIGQTIKFKFCSFNVFGGGLEQLADVTEYSYEVTGRFRQTTVTSASSNRIRNATLELNVAEWSSFDNLGGGRTRLQKTTPENGWGPNDSIPGSPSNAVMVITDSSTGNGKSGWTLSSRASASPGQRWYGGAGLIGNGTDAYVAIEWRDASGNPIGTSSLSLPVAADGTPAAGFWNKPANYQDRHVFAVAPTGTATATLVVLGTGNWTSQPAKYVAWTRPMLGLVAPGVTDPPPWDPGGANPVDTGLIAPGAATAVIRRDTIPGPVAFAQAVIFSDINVGADLRGYEVAVTATFDYRAQHLGSSPAVVDTTAWLTMIDGNGVEYQGQIRTLLRDLNFPVGYNATRLIEMTQRWSIPASAPPPYTFRLRGREKFALAGTVIISEASVIDHFVEIIKR